MTGHVCMFALRNICVRGWRVCSTSLEICFCIEEALIGGLAVAWWRERGGLCIALVFAEGQPHAGEHPHAHVALPPRGVAWRRIVLGG